MKKYMFLVLLLSNNTYGAEISSLLKEFPKPPSSPVKVERYSYGKFGSDSYVPVPAAAPPSHITVMPLRSSRDAVADTSTMSTGHTISLDPTLGADFDRLTPSSLTITDIETILKARIPETFNRLKQVHQKQLVNFLAIREGSITIGRLREILEDGLRDGDEDRFMFLELTGIKNLIAHFFYGTVILKRK